MTDTKRIEKWVWLLVYGGLIVGGLGLAVRPSDASLGWGLASIGGALIVGGATLIWLRSRIKTDKT
jgi:hypothetical protein